jgi:2-amino-4-hydroxy-6-hydroxymethyldihydropteridine diphosphokinase
MSGETLSPATDAYVALGSNLGDPLGQVEQAFEALNRLPATRLVARSRLYRSTPMGGPPGQPDYLNAVARLVTGLAPLDLLRGLQAIEQASGRQRGERWGPRTLDLDVLVYGSVQIDSAELQVPHPRMTERPFVLLPLYEVAPSDLSVPGFGLLRDLVARNRTAGVEPLTGPRARAAG